MATTPDAVNVTASGDITRATPCVTLSFALTKSSLGTARGISVSFRLDGGLQLCTDPHLTHGAWLAGYANHVYPSPAIQGSNPYTIDQYLNGAPCGPTNGGDLFTIDVTSLDLAGPGTGTVTITEVLLFDCDLGADMGAVAGAPLAIRIGADPDVVTTSASGGIANLTPCVTLTFDVARNMALPARGFNLTFQLSSELKLCTPVQPVLGPWLLGFGGTQSGGPVDHGGGLYEVYGAILGTDCGPTGGGTLYQLAVTAADGVSSGTGTVTVTAIDLRDCGGDNIPAVSAGTIQIPIDLPPPDPVAGLVATQVKHDNNPPPPPSTFSKHINFQPAAAPTPTDYEADTGLSFNTTRGYGWFSTVIPIERTLLPNDPSDTFVKKANANSPARWEIVVPQSGDYRVRVGVGDALTQGTHIVKVEGITFFDGLLTQGATFESVIQTVTVTDGRLSMDIGGARVGTPPLTETKVDLIEVDAVTLASTAGGDDPAPAATGETTGIQIDFTPPPAGCRVEVYRAGFGNYPEYDDPGPGGTTGSVPALPTYPPDPARWTLTSVTQPLQTDRPSERDFCYYAAFVLNGVGVASTASMTAGTLDYHLGDVEDGLLATNCVGDDQVNFLDVSFLSIHYGQSLGDNDPNACLDMGPTSTGNVNGRPLTDNRIDFKDLIYSAVNFLSVSKQTTTPAPAASDQVALEAPAQAGAGSDLDAAVLFMGTGRVQGLSVALAWDPQVVEPGVVTTGRLLEEQGGIALTPGQGVVDVALLGPRTMAISGTGPIASLRFRVLRDGDPGIRIVAVDARDAELQSVAVGIGMPTDQTTAVPRVTALEPNVPNPFNPTTSIGFSLARPGTIDVAVYAVDGRRIKRLVAGYREPGRYAVVWDGTNESGTRVPSGVYYARLVAGDMQKSMPITLVK